MPTNYKDLPSIKWFTIQYMVIIIKERERERERRRRRGRGRRRRKTEEIHFDNIQLVHLRIDDRSPEGEQRYSPTFSLT